MCNLILQPTIIFGIKGKSFVALPLALALHLPQCNFNLTPTPFTDLSQSRSGPKFFRKMAAKRLLDDSDREYQDKPSDKRFRATRPTFASYVLSSLYQHLGFI